MLSLISPSEVATAARILARYGDEQAIAELDDAENSAWVRRELRRPRGAVMGVTRRGFQCQACRRTLSRHNGECPGCGFQPGRGYRGT